MPFSVPFQVIMLMLQNLFIWLYMQQKNIYIILKYYSIHKLRFALIVLILL